MKRKKKTRREFLSEAAGYAAGTVGSGVLGSMVTGCGGDAVVDPDPNDDTDDPLAPVTAAISGPDELQIPSLWQPVTGEFDGSGSTGPTGKSYSWSVTKDNDGFQEGEIDLGKRPTASHVFNKPGGYTVKLKIRNTPRVEDVAEHQTLVKQAELPVTNHPPIAFKVHEGSGVYAIYLMDRKRSPLTKLVASAQISGQRLNWEPSGERLLLSLGGPNSCRVHSYNLVTGEMLQISHGQTGLHWAASWNPKKDWIVYTSDERVKAIDEFCLVRPDGSEQFYLHPAFSNRLLSGMYPSWDPEGERFAAATCVFDLFGTGELHHRVGIHEDLWGTPTRYPIPSEDQLMSLLDNYSGGSEALFNEFYNAFAIGMGLAWSPDGQHILYRVVFGYVPNQHHLLVRSRPDGTGDVEVIAESKNHDGPIRYPGVGGITWSPEGTFAIFGAHTENGRALYKYTPGVGVSLFYDALQAFRPTLYD